MQTPADIADDIYALYDEYCHSQMERRDFLRRAAGFGAGGLALATTLLPNYARAQTISFTDPRIHARYVTYPSPGGTTKTMRGYLVEPTAKGKVGTVLVVHENRGLNPYVEDVARRVAAEGFLAFAPDALTAAGGYPGNDDDGKVMQRKLDPARIYADMLNGARFVKSHARSNGKLGVTGFCFGGGVANFLAAKMGKDLQAAAPFYGRAADLDQVPHIQATMLLHYADDDPRVNAMRPDYEAALKKHKVTFTSFTYKGTKHGFHNNSTPRYHAASAKLAWDRTLALFRTALA